MRRRSNLGQAARRRSPKPIQYWPTSTTPLALGTPPANEVLIYRAQDLLGGPVAKIHIPHRPNTGFHGNWIPDAEIEQATGAL